MMKKSISSKNLKRLEKIGKKIEELRIAGGDLNRDFFAFEKKINKNTLANIEKGKGGNIITLLNILDALNKSPKEFFSEID